MSFIGEIRPLVKGNSNHEPDRRPALLLALGFTVSAIAAFALAGALGFGLLGRLRDTVVPAIAAVGVLAVLLAADARLFGWRTPMWNRQTPKWFMYRFGVRTTALLWGLDAGLVFTTIRVTSLSWAALWLTFVGVLPWWSGAAYAVGFVVPELVFDLLVPRRTDPTGVTEPEPTWVVTALSGRAPALRRTALAALGAVAGWLVLAALVWG